MSSIVNYSYDNFLRDFLEKKLNGIYLISAGVMAYVGIIRSIDSESIIMDLPLKYYIGENVMYTPVIVGREEIESIKEIPLEGHMHIETKDGNTIDGTIHEIFSNRMKVITDNNIEIIYYQDITDVSNN